MRRVAADRTGLLHSLAAAARSVRASKVAERSAGGELADRLKPMSPRPFSVTYMHMHMHMCMHMHMHMHMYM